jgi:hypothetical protein
MRVTLAVLTSLLLAAIPVLGCGVCSSFNGNPLSLPHPRAIEIAVATRSALDKGILRERQLETTISGWNRKTPPGSGLEALKAWLETKNAGKVAVVRDPVSLHIVLIDTSETAAIHFRSGAVVLDPQPSGTGDAVVATTSHGLQALLSGELSVEKAIKMKLAVIEGRQSLASALGP